MEKEVGTQTILKALDEPDPYERPGCPMTWLLGILARKWVFPVLFQLYQAESPLRFASFQRTIRRINQKELTKTLRDLERDGFITRTAYPEVPPRVEYALAPLGESLRQPILALGDWATTYRPRRPVATETSS